MLLTSRAGHENDNLMVLLSLPAVTVDGCCLHHLSGDNTYKTLPERWYRRWNSMTDTTDNVLQKYQNYSSTIVSDALDEHEIEGVLIGINPAHPAHKAVGRARPVRFEAAPEDADRTNFPSDLFDAFNDGDVFVFDSISPEISCWGELASRLAAKAGVQGTVINGGFRDYNGIRERDYGVFGVQPTPRSGQPRLRIAAIDDPVTIQDVTIETNDIVVADGTGIAVVPQETASAVAETAEKILSKELVLDQRVANGADADTLLEEYKGF